MPRLILISQTGHSRTIEAIHGLTVMENLVRNSIEGIDADCDGACACATCHIYVDESWASRLPSAEYMEIETLDFACDVQATSRLSCQIKMTDSLDGLIIHIPKQQR